MTGVPVGVTDDGVAARVLGLLRGRSETLATAESLTGGMIGAVLTDVPGASAAYVGGVVTYATRLKSELAGVNPAVLDARGPVDGLTARQMALGVAARCGADWGLAVTGVAGPDPQDGHPVGQVFLAVAHRSDGGSYTVDELRLSGSRSDIRAATVDAALELLATALGNAAARSDVDPTGG